MLKLNIRLKLLMLNKRLILGIMVIVFVLTVFATKSIYNYMVDKNNNINQDNKIDSVVTVTYDIPTVTNTPIIIPIVSPTIIPTVAPTIKAELVSRGNSLRGREIKDVDNKVDFKYIDSFIADVTAYTLHPSECLKSPNSVGYGIAASGKYVVEGTTIATSDRYKFGTKIKIEGFKSTFTVLDRGGDIQNNRIDIYMNSRTQAFKFGRKKLKAYIIEYAK